MCNTYAKGTSSVEVQKADTTTGRCIFLQKNATVDILEIKNPAQIICKGFLDATWSDTYFRVFYKYNTDTRRFELHFQDNSDVFAINSYGLKNCQATTD
jgi:hypothetical protein